MNYTPHNIISIELNKQKLKTYISDVENARLMQSSILEPGLLMRTADKLLLEGFTGIILSDLSDAQKVVYIKNGEVVFARSSVNDERLGETLCRMGKLTVEQLDKASKEITPSRKLGKILVENGHITSRDLWLGVRRQIFEIWGSYILPANNQPSWFHVIKSDVDETNIIRPTSNMLDSLFEFLREKAESINIIPGNDDVVRLNYLTNSVTFDEFEKAIIRHLLASNNSSFSNIAKSIHADIQSMQHALKPLVYTGILDIIKQPEKVEVKTEEARFEELVNLTNTIMMSIAEIMDKKAADVNFKNAVKEYIRLSNGMFKDCPLNSRGCFDTDTIMSVYKNSRLLSPYDEAVNYIKELIHFELFEMKNYLSKDQTEELENIIASLE